MVHRFILGLILPTISDASSAMTNSMNLRAADFCPAGHYMENEPDQSSKPGTEL